MANITKDEVLEWVKNAPALELAELVNEMEEVFGVSAAAPVAVAAAPGAGGGDAGAAEEKTSFDVVLTGAGDKKIQVIKAVRELTDLGLKEAKDVVDNPPKPILEGVEKDKADEAKAKIEEAGGTADVQ
jgi:large subunit ribosomal protein L7/L12